jgi:hypothetical protein
MIDYCYKSIEEYDDGGEAYDTLLPSTHMSLPIKLVDHLNGEISTQRSHDASEPLSVSAEEQLSHSSSDEGAAVEGRDDEYERSHEPKVSDKEVELVGYGEYVCN